MKVGDTLRYRRVSGSIYDRIIIAVGSEKIELDTGDTIRIWTINNQGRYEVIPKGTNTGRVSCSNVNISNTPKNFCQEIPSFYNGEEIVIRGSFQAGSIIQTGVITSNNFFTENNTMQELITKPTLYKGVDISTMSEDTLIAEVKVLTNRINDYSSFPEASTKITENIAKCKDAIKELLSALDAKK